MTYELVLTTRDLHETSGSEGSLFLRKTFDTGKVLLMSEDGGSAKSYAAIAAVGIFGGGVLLAVPLLVLLVVLLVIIFGGFGVLLAPLIALLGDGGDTGDISADEISAVVQGDGKGEFDVTSVAVDLVEPIQRAGQLCPEIGPVVIAAQLEQASNFDNGLIGPAGEQGIAQLPPAVFTQFGEDDDGDGDISALDDEDAIMTLGRFNCSLAGQLKNLVIDGDGDAELLSLTLAAVKAGVDPVREAGAVPSTAEIQSYVNGVRARFPKFQGLVTEN
ncbi:lytic transglycosylase domain-containing protein [Lentzea tibetensis]|uniref:Lytic transglycosylase domain-containing protein n=1 Tax=Lentzea tibetensis TaxID=2591470 RepID=A0A563EFL4_9PSEU|nr:lytic transglycosylase domain-containing protein [Lentzea tibetensis]TWP44517.1 lytic transglycosylase domain-containing protein [Lentzea tibetensis]